MGTVQKEKGGPLTVERITFEEGRGNVIITYPGKTDKTLGLVGRCAPLACPQCCEHCETLTCVVNLCSHLDVVPANPETWERNPFELSVEGDKLYGRGTTDCLGHVATITELFIQMAEAKVELDVTVAAVFIASEEAEAKVLCTR